MASDPSEDLKEWLELCSEEEQLSSLPSDGLGLCMIVKNEAHVIERCLMSVRPVISHWTIVDTGSTDGTQEIIRKSRVLKGVPGELHERPWKNFASNRNEALELAVGKTSHVLVIDADDALELADNFRPLKLTEDAYLLTVLHGEFTHARVHVFRPELFKYIGVIHEVIWPVTPDRRIHTMRMRIIGGGNRSRDPERPVRDAEIIQRALEQEPKDSYLARRYTLFLAKSWLEAYRVSGNKSYLAPALEAYEKRATMGGYPEEVYLALSESFQVRKIISECECDSPTKDILISSHARATYSDLNRNSSREIHVISTGFAAPLEHRARCLASVAEQRGVKVVHHVIDAAEQSPAKNKLENIHDIVSVLEPETVVVEVDLDDELSHPEALKIISDLYDDPNVWLTYGSFAESSDPSKVVRCGEYIDPTRCRSEIWRASHLKTYRAGLFQSVPVEEWKDLNGTWAYFACDLVTMFPMLERAGKTHVRYVPEILYLYHRETSHEQNHEFVRQGFIENARLRARSRLPLLFHLPKSCRVAD